MVVEATHIALLKGLKVQEDGKPDPKILGFRQGEHKKISLCLSFPLSQRTAKTSKNKKPESKNWFFGLRYRKTVNQT